MSSALDLFADPERARAAAGSDAQLAYVEQREWGAIGLVPYQRDEWTVAAFVGAPRDAQLVAHSYTEPRMLNIPISMLPLTVAGAVLGGLVGILLRLPQAAMFLAVVGGGLGYWAARLRTRERDRSIDKIRLTGGLTDLVRCDTEGLIPALTVGRMLRLAASSPGRREAVERIGARVWELFDRDLTSDLRSNVQVSVVDLVDAYLAHPDQLAEPTLEALDRLAQAMREWTKARAQLQATADAPVTEAKAAEEKSLRQRAADLIAGAEQALRTDTQAMREVDEELRER